VTIERTRPRMGVREKRIVKEIKDKDYENHVILRD
jgi:hypothetical protein